MELERSGQERNGKGGKEIAEFPFDL